MLGFNKKEISNTYQEWLELLEHTDKLIHKVQEIDSKDYELLSYLNRTKQFIEKRQRAIIETVVKEVTGETLAPQKAEAKLTLEASVSIIKAVERRAEEMGVAVVIAIYNKDGNPIAIHCMEDSYLASYDIAIGKAYTSAALKMSTNELKRLSQPGGSLYGIQNTNQGKIVIFAGGEPLIVEGTILASIGVSGGTEEEDAYLAQFAKELIKEVL